MTFCFKTEKIIRHLKELSIQTALIGVDGKHYLYSYERDLADFTVISILSSLGATK